MCLRQAQASLTYEKKRQETHEIKGSLQKEI